MTRVRLGRALAVGATLGSLLVGGCGSNEAGKPISTGTAERPRELALAQFSKGVGAVEAGAKAPIWNDPAGVAAVDGSAVFSVRSGAPAQLARLDRHSGAVVSSWPIEKGLAVTAVAPDGKWVALTDRRPGYEQSSDSFTELVVFDAVAGKETHRLTLSGSLQPEAFSFDGSLVFALKYLGDHYRVQTIELATGRQFDTSDRDKTVKAEDMEGATVRGVLSGDRTLLATLYRNPGDDEEPAFVHVLDLEHGWSYCADLPQPFGTGPAGSDVIELTPTNTVVVAATKSSRVAEIHIEEVHEPGNVPVAVEYRAGTVAPNGSAFRSTPGFGHVITSLPV